MQKYIYVVAEDLHRSTGSYEAFAAFSNADDAMECMINYANEYPQHDYKVDRLPVNDERMKKGGIE